jgi:hypothetical protein
MQRPRALASDLRPSRLRSVGIRSIAQGQVDYGTITAIEIYRASDNQPINAGTVLGGIAGGVIGHPIGSGRGNTAATIAGTIGGTLVGTQIEKNKVQARATVSPRSWIRWPRSAIVATWQRYSAYQSEAMPDLIAEGSADWPREQHADPAYP